MRGSMLKSAAILGLLAAVGPFAIDMFLPAMPAITEDLNTTIAATQATLTAYFIAFGLAQMVYGPWADQVGRKPPLYTGLIIFLLGTVGCVVAPSIEILIGSRVVQALGAAVLMVVPRAVIRDLHTGPKATQLMAMIMLVISVSPMLAPLAGSLLLLVADWRMIFVVLGVAALLSLILTYLVVEETLEPEASIPVNLRSLARGTRVLMTDKTFMGLTFVGGFGMASFFVFLASAAFVYTQQFGLSEIGFSVAFAINAVGFFSASQVAAPLGMKIGMERTVLIGTIGFAVFACLAAMVSLAGWLTLPLMVGLLFCANAFLGLVIPTTMVMSLDPHGEIAGLASSLGGTLQMVAGGVMIVLTAPFFDGSATPLLCSIALCSLIALVIGLAVLRSAPSAQSAP
ncbi:multidrug effflux MFS transporter [Shimia ponticola]|uniref:multidrug effflux MFS transporter n=1 Tax=Shimia ponticola TaxID=2582893 RepID=UPI002101D8B5|nr:multidrug effflux MFS transporter [Shimia ponticola]